MIEVQKFRYLAVGGINTLVGYGIGVVLYKLFGGAIHIFIIGIAANILSISFSFITYKTLVFRTVGHWLKEYFKAYVVYGGLAILGILLLWLFVDKMNLSIWMAQGLVTALTVIVSYIAHARFTFRAKPHIVD